MKLPKILKIIISISLAILFFSGSFFLSAYWTQFVFSLQTMDVTLGSLESSSTDFVISPDSSFPDFEGETPYAIYSFSHCNEYDNDWNCIDSVPNLCPYLSLEPKDGEATEIGFTQNTLNLQATGVINFPNDAIDDWNIKVHSPCFEGKCPADYDELQNGAPLPQSQKGQTFKCDLNVDATDPPDLVKNYLMQNVAYADTFLNTLEVSAVFTGETTTCITDCFSNVLFLPGLMGSRLYEEGLDCGTDIVGPECGDQELWVSSSGLDQAKLELNNQGKSINSLYTKDDTQNNGENETGIIDEIFGANIYNSFIDDLKNWKQDGVIADYAFIPYDWRLSLDDVITNGTTSTNNNLSYISSQNFAESFILKKLEALQSTSKSGKVTIITHSNGGLVAKALVQKLKDTNNPLYNKIDKIIFVAVPQVGTPDAVAALLHGTELGYGFIMGKDRSRQLSENMSSVYNFLPSAGYFTMIEPAFTIDKIASFENKTFFNPQISKYGVDVSDEIELIDYILGTDGRDKPSFSDTVHPNIGNSTLYTQTKSVHHILDYFWSPHPDTKIIQVAGWGEETIAGIDYKSYVSFFGSEYLSYKPRWVIDGDGTVVVPSALWMSTLNPNVERWWVNLKKFNKNNLPDRVHKSILEVLNLRDFIKSKIMDSVFTDTDNIIVDNTSTLISDGSRLHYTLHSPLTLGIEVQDKYTGQDPITKQIREEIPGVTYKQIGDVQFLSVPNDLAYTVKMQGYQEGNFSLDVDKQIGNEITESTSFQGIPSSISTLATINITPNFEVSNSILEIYQNNIIDKILNATADGITVYDTNPPELQVTFNTNIKDVFFSAKDLSDPNPTILTTNTSTTLADNNNNVTIIPFTKFKEKTTKLKFSYIKIIRNGITSVVPNTHVIYDWQEKKGILTDLDTKVTVKGVEKYIFNYKKANNVTIIKEKTSSGIITTTRPGFVVVTVRTEVDDVKVDY